MRTTDYAIEMQEIREENDLRSRYIVELLNTNGSNLAETILIQRLREAGIKVILSDKLEVLFNNRVFPITKNPELTLRINKHNHRTGLKPILNYFGVSA